MQSYSNLELDLHSGKRGGRLKGVQERLCELVGAQAALVVNNNAAATLLAISTVAQGGEVIVSRGELVEIGGSFRIPDIIETGGALLREVGCTNRTRVSDYERAISCNTKAFLKVHSSNFSVIGFTQTTSRQELVSLSKKTGIPCIEDLGSGLLDKAPAIPDAERLYREESVKLAIKEGVDLVTFSGDKLLGGPQAGFIVGTEQWIAQCRKHPLYRALRLGKISLAALEATLQMYIEGREDEIPVWQMLQKPLETCRAEAEYLRDALGCGSVIPTQSFSGGGALPNQAIDSFAFSLAHPNAQHVAEQLRIGTPAVLIRLHRGCLIIEPRTLLEGELQMLILRLKEVLQTYPV